MRADHRQCTGGMEFLAVAAQLAKGPVVIVAGRANLAESTASTVAALQQLLAAVPGSKVLPAYRRGNVVGALQLGLHNTGDGLDVRNILKASAEGRIECLIVLGADPLSDVPDAGLARSVRGLRRRIERRHHHAPRCPLRLYLCERHRHHRHVGPRVAEMIDGEARRHRPDEGGDRVADRQHREIFRARFGLAQ